MEATCAISVLPPTSLDCFLMLSTAAWTPFSMPFFRPVGLAPAATLRRPSVMSAWASTVAVVVPSPATSLVLVATSFTSWAPMFSNGSSSSTSRAMDTPSLVMVGAPNFFSITTLRPFGPSVTLTVSASLFTPASSPRRADSSNFRILGMGKRNSSSSSRTVLELLVLENVVEAAAPIRMGPGRRADLSAAGPAGAGSPRATTTQASLARMSRAERMRTSSPSRMYSVPPYLE